VIELQSRVDKMSQEGSYPTVGDKNLMTIDSAANFTNWMYEEIRPFLSGHILELGSGIGTYSEKVIGDFKESIIVLSDIDEIYIRNLERRFASNRNVVVKKIDLSKQGDLRDLNVSIDSVFALNVLEHIDDDTAALSNIYEVLKPGGRFIILVPAHQFLFNCIDRAIGHYRRYSRKQIIAKVEQARFKIVELFYFNFAAIAGWYINGSIFRQAKVNEGAVGILNKIVPILKPIERYILLRKLGISLIVVLSKPEPAVIP